MQTKHLGTVGATRPDAVPVTGFDHSNNRGGLPVVSGAGRNAYAISASTPEAVTATGRGRRLVLPDADSDPMPPRRCRWNADYL